MSVRAQGSSELSQGMDTRWLDGSGSVDATFNVTFATQQSIVTILVVRPLALAARLKSHSDSRLLIITSDVTSTEKNYNQRLRKSSRSLPPSHAHTLLT